MMRNPVTIRFDKQDMSSDRNTGWLGFMRDSIYCIPRYMGINKPLPIPSMGLLYLPTFTIKINQM